MHALLIIVLLILPVFSEARSSYPPLASTDSTILLDVTLTSQAAATAAGFVLEGTGHVFDANGFNGKGTGNLRMNSWSGASAVAAQGTLYLQFERLAVSWSNTNNAGYDNLFHDSLGTDTGADRYVWTNYNGGSTNARQVFYQGNGSPDSFRLNYVMGGASQITDITTFNSHQIPSYQDSQYTEVVLTWQGTRWYWYVDGHMVKTGLSASAPSSTDFDGFRVGSQGTGTKLLGDFYIKRIQISTTFCPPITFPVRIAGYGDSFVLASTEGTTPGSDTGTAIDVAQIAVTNDAPNFGRSRGQASFMHGLRALSWTNYGFYFPYYNAGKSGYGWEKTPFPAVYRDSINRFNPRYVIALQSVNDVSTSSPVTNIVANTKAMLDTLIDGNTELRMILFITGIDGHQDPTKIADTGWLAEYKRIRGLLIAGVDGYRSKVRVIDLYDAWGGDSYPVSQTIGSSLTNTVTYGNDQHPSATGHQVIASILWPYLSPYLAAHNVITQPRAVRN